MVHAGDHCVIERTLERGLIDIVLVLTHADRLGIDLHQLCQRIHETPADRNRAAHCEIEIGKFLPRDFRGRINRRTRFTDHDDSDRGRKAQRPHKRLGLARRGAVADGDRLDFVACDHGLQHLGGLGALAGTALGVDHLVREQFPLRIEHHHLAASAETGIERKHRLLPERRGQQQLAKVFRKHTDRLLVGLLLVEKPRLALHRKPEKPLVAILRRQSDLLRGGVRPFHKQVVQNRKRLLLGRSDPREKHPLSLAAADRQKAVRRTIRNRFAPVEVVLELRRLGLLVEDHLGL